MEEKGLKEKLKRDLNELKIEIKEEDIDKLFVFKNKILEWNEKINLTAITKDEEFVIKHIEDSLTVAKYFEKNEKIIDVGTGGGFPGIPLNIILENNSITLFDSLNKRINVLKEISKELELDRIDFIHGRAEEAFKQRDYREKYDVAISRAVASLPTLVELMLPAVKVGGKCICMKGNNVQEEIIEAQTAIKILGGEIDKVEKIVLPNTDIIRHIIIIKKIKTTPKGYPRKPGIPQKNPIK